MPQEQPPLKRQRRSMLMDEPASSSDGEPSEEEAPMRRIRQAASQWQDPQQEDGEEESSSQPSTSNSDSDGSSDEEDEGDMQQSLEQQVAQVPFEVLEKLRQDGTGLAGQAARAAALAAKKKTFHRETKNRPTEMSSKRPVARFREVIQLPKQAHQDPRFESTTTAAKAFSKDAFRKRYAFLYDELLPKEKAQLKARLKKEKSESKRAEMQAELTRMEQQIRDEQASRKREKLEKGWKSEEKAAVAQGKRPFFLKRSDKRKRELLAKYAELQTSGRLDKYMAKRRKKNAAKDHRYLPSGRRE